MKILFRWVGNVLNGMARFFLRVGESIPPFVNSQVGVVQVHRRPVLHIAQGSKKDMHALCRVGMYLNKNTYQVVSLRTIWHHGLCGSCKNQLLTAQDPYYWINQSRFN